MSQLQAEPRRAQKLPGRTEMETGATPAAPGSPGRALVQRGEAAARDVVALQRAAGNRAVTQLFGRARVQTKLAVGAARDRYELEADRVAAAVLDDSRGDVAPPRVSALAGDAELRCDFTARGGGAAPATVERALLTRQPSGRPLPPDVRADLEPRFGRSFAPVRIHTGAAADRLNRSLGARAFTRGGDIFFRDGAYAPGTRAGRRLLAHELTHVMQQGGHAGAIQRYVGFEAELEVPTFPRAPAHVNRNHFHRGPGRYVTVRTRRGPQRHYERPDAPPEVVQFLTGALDYDRDRGHNADFKVGTDHGGFDDVRGPLYDRLIRLGFADRIRSEASSNLEYATLGPPNLIDELAAGSNARVQTITDAVRAHVRQILPLAEDQMIRVPAPAHGMWTGVPRRAFRDWLGPDYRRIRDELDDCSDALRDRLYLQVTTGILPSSIPSLFHSRTTGVVGAVHPNALRQAAIDETETGVQALLALPAFQADPYVQALRATGNPADYESLQGILYLVYSYLIGDAAAQTTSILTTAKNAVPFLSQSRLGRIINAAGTTWLDQHNPPDRLVTIVENFLAARPLATRQGWVNLGQVALNNPPAVIHDRPHFISDVLQGRRVETVSPHNLNFDPSPAVVQAASGNQRGVPLEHRYITVEPSSGQLFTEVMRVVNEVRQLNMRHLTLLERQTLTAAF